MEGRWVAGGLALVGALVLAGSSLGVPREDASMDPWKGKCRDPYDAVVRPTTGDCVRGRVIDVGGCDLGYQCVQVRLDLDHGERQLTLVSKDPDPLVHDGHRSCFLWWMEATAGIGAFGVQLRSQEVSS